MRELYVTFHQTGTYIYYDVPESVYAAFLAAESKGAFFNAQIRDRYSYRPAGMRR